MEIVASNQFYGSLKRYWRRKRYQRLDGASSNRKNLKVARFGGNKRRFWRIRAVPKLRFLRFVSPIKLLTRIRDAYIDMMFNLAGNVGSLNGGNFFKTKNLPKPRQNKMFAPYAELDSRLVLEIYKAMMASRELSLLSDQGV